MMKDELEDWYIENISVNQFQLTYMLLQAKQKYIIVSRGGGKSFVNGFEVDENIRLMPRGITSLTQATYGQTLTKTLPSTFKYLDMLGYRRWDEKLKTGDYVVCRKPPEGWFTPYEQILSYDHCITFSNGHTLFLLSQDSNSRGPSVDYNITDEALTLAKDKFDQEVAPTNRGNETIFGKQSKKPLFKHHGNTFLSSMPYTGEQKWLLAPAEYYEKEADIRVFDIWNRIVKLQLQLIQEKIDNNVSNFKDIWNETVRLRKTISPFVSQDGTLFLLGSIFDNIQNVGMEYIVKQFNVMDLMTFMIEILNYYIDKVDNCYYQLDDRHIYYNATDDSYIRDFAENTDFDFNLLQKDNCRYDLDCNPNKPIEVTCDWGSTTAFMEVGQEGNYDFVTKTLSQVPIDNNINEFIVKRDESPDVMVNAIVDKFCDYYQNHINKRVIYFRDRYGDIRLANSKKSYNEQAIDRFIKRGWKIEQRVHAGIEPPQHDKYLLWSNILIEKESKFPIKRFNGTKCKYTLISMNNTRVRENAQGKFDKDKTSERRKSILPEEATHLGDAVDKRIWTKYGHLMKKTHIFIPTRT